MKNTNTPTTTNNETVDNERGVREDYIAGTVLEELTTSELDLCVGGFGTGVGAELELVNPGSLPPQFRVTTTSDDVPFINDKLLRFPPQGDVYRLIEPVQLAPVGAPDQVVAVLQQFPVTVTHNP